MVQIAGEVVIRQPVEIVFDTLADPRRERNYNDRVRSAEMLTPGPIAVGSRFEQQVRALGRTDRATIDITGFERPSRLAFTIHSAAMVTLGNLHFEEVAEGTLATYAWDMQARGVARLFEPLLGLFAARLERDVWEGLRRFLEGETDEMVPAALDRHRRRRERTWLRKKPAIATGVWQPGMAYLRVGAGEPLLFLPGITPRHELPVGLDRRFQLAQLTRLSHARQVWWVNRRTGLAPGVTMAELAADYAKGIRRWFAEPIDVLGVSTGGSVALQLAADHPDVVRRLVLVSSACRLAPYARHSQRELARYLAEGDLRRAGIAMNAVLGAGPVSDRMWKGLGWLTGPRMFAGGAPDMCATIEAEDAYDLTDRLSGIRVPALVVGGDRDAAYGAALFRETAEGLPNAKLLLYSRTGHVGVQAHRRFVPDVLRFLS